MGPQVRQGVPRIEPLTLRVMMLFSEKKYIFCERFDRNLAVHAHNSFNANRFNFGRIF